MSKEKIMLGMPAYGGNVQVLCFKSVLRLFQDPRIAAKYTLEVIALQNESLISRARQELAKAAITRGYDRLFFIDADTAFTPDQFLAIVDADKEVIGGTYLKKSLQKPGLNFNVTREINEEMLRRFGITPTTLAGFEIFKREYCKESPIVKVNHVPTGFLSIKTDVLRRLSEKVPQYLSGVCDPNRVFYSPEEVEKMKVAELFPVSVQNGTLESEDWGFCRLCRENGIEVYLHTGVVVEHIGQITFHPSMFQPAEK
ncbi:hypothetical protein HY496_00905 [Candidatus Woesearchaeota archaeon]|nr:hypothetical protein [Candidatus Woesearchaeota archaeon]